MMALYRQLFSPVPRSEQKLFTLTVRYPGEVSSSASVNDLMLPEVGATCKEEKKGA